MRRFLAVFLIVSLAGVSIPTFVRTIHRRVVGVRSEVFLEDRNVEYYYSGEVRTIVEQMALSLQRPPIDATLDKETGEIIPQKNGLYVDIDDTVFRVMAAPANTKLSLTTIEVVPMLREEHLAALTAVLGDFSTPVMGSPGRVTNLRLSLAAINNTIVMPDEVFSFNGVVGERTPERGYKPAPIILGEAVASGVGGGICQTSSTLYNAVRRAELEIVERRIHSIAPSYIQHGRDATVAWPHTDFKFANSLPRPIIVRAAIQGWRVRVWILGAAQ